MSTDTANCMCRVISVEVEGEPAAMGIVIASFVAPGRPARLMAWQYGPVDKMTITKRKDQIDSYASSEGHQRAWCKKCGGHVFHDVGPFGVVDVYASLVQDPSSSRRFI